MAKIHAQARVTYTAAGSPAGTYLDGLVAPRDTGVGVVSFSLGAPIDRTVSCVLCSLTASGTGTPPTRGGYVCAEVGGSGTPDTQVRVRIFDSGTVAVDPAVGAGFCVVVTRPGS